MPRQISQAKVIAAIIGAIEGAQRFYESCSGGLWLEQAPEYLLCTSIAAQLHKLEGAKHVTLETHVASTLDEAGAVKRGAPRKELRRNGRFDLVLWWGGELPRAAIEVKNGVWSFRQLQADIARLSRVVLRNAEESSFQFGLMAFYLSAQDNHRTKSKQQVRNLTEHLLAKTREHTPAGIVVTARCSAIHTSGDSSWVAVCFVLRAGPTNRCS